MLSPEVEKGPFYVDEVAIGDSVAVEMNDLGGIDLEVMFKGVVNPVLESIEIPKSGSG
jgi:hypothetical protein